MALRILSAFVRRNIRMDNLTVSNWHTAFLSKFWIRWFLNGINSTQWLKQGCSKTVTFKSSDLCSTRRRFNYVSEIFKIFNIPFKIKTFSLNTFDNPLTTSFYPLFSLSWRLKSPIFTLPPEANKMANLTFLVSARNEIRNGHYVLLGVYNLSQ